MKLSEHFELEEFTRNSYMFPNQPSEKVIPLLKEFCTIILEPIRKYVNSPVVITSGYRSEALNKFVGGVKDSYHCATEERCAVDIQTPKVLLLNVFQWLRLTSNLPFDKIILEFGKNSLTEKDDCIHIQYRAINPRRLAFIGLTHGQGNYTQISVN